MLYINIDHGAETAGINPVGIMEERQESRGVQETHQAAVILHAAPEPDYKWWV